MQISNGVKELIKKIIPSFLINFYHFSLAFSAALIYRFPSKKLKIIGITGTNGKSTVVEMVSKILEEADYKVAVLSSIKFKIKDKEWQNTLRMTMPGRFILQKFLRQAVNSQCQYAVLEVTSEGIKQYRHKFIDFEVAVLTNLSPEHIEAHGSFEKYRQAKRELFLATKGIHIINLDDENAGYFLKFPAKHKFGFTISDRHPIGQELFSTITARNIKVLASGLKFYIDDTEFNLKLLAKFNVYNSLAAVCIGLSQGISLEICKSALEKIKGVPGRMEMVISQPFKVFVDYAFTPNALQKVYETLSKSKVKSQKSKVICVLGSCGGGRDKWKRPVLGKLAAKYCQEVIVTNEDPYDEDPMEIIAEVAKGTEGKAKKILDRREAIREAISLAKTKDIIIITGKGCEPSICLAGGKKIPWDDRKVAKEEFEKLFK